MFNSIKNILITICLGVLFAIILLFYLNAMLNVVETEIQSKQSIVKVNSNGEIEVCDIVTINVDKNSNGYISIPITMYEIDEDFSSKSKFVVEKRSEEINSVTFDGKKLHDKTMRDFAYPNEKICYYKGGKGVVIVANVTPGIYTVEIIYTYKNIDIVKQYNDVTVFKLKNDKTIKNSYVELTLPSKVTLFETKDKKTVITKLSDSKYSVDMSNTKKEYIDILINNNIIKDAQIINGQYNYSKVDDFLKYNYTEHLGILCLIELIIVSLVLVITKKPKVNEEYIVRTPDIVIEPIIAESIIDRKIGGKELIMSCIVNLICKGNIRNIGNEKIELLNSNNLTKYEKDIVNLIFDNHTIIEFKDIKEKFIQDNNETKWFYKKFKEIKNKIEEEIYDSNIYSRKGEFVLKIIRVIIWLMYANLAYLMYITIFPYKGGTLGIYNIIALIIAVGIVFLRPYMANIEVETKVKKQRTGFYIVIILVYFIISIILGIKDNTSMFFIIFVLTVINTILLMKSNTHIFTSTGKIEYERAVGLKKYIEEYSIIKERDLDNVILWDEYLAYAVAFGISNKVMFLIK